MKRIYVAHPYGGEKENKKSVEVIIRELVKKEPKILYISPIHSFGYLYNDVEYLHGMEFCFELLGICDELILCKGWESSRGCNLEKLYAEKKGIPITYL